MTANKHKPVSLASLGGMALVSIAFLQMCAGADREDQEQVPRRRMLRAQVQAGDPIQTQPSSTTAKQCYPACVSPKFCSNGECAQKVRSKDESSPTDMGHQRGFLFAEDPGRLRPGELPMKLISETQPPSP